MSQQSTPHDSILVLPPCRNLPTAHLKVLVGNYTSEGLVGWQLSGKTYGVVGTGNIGVEFIKLLKVRAACSIP